MRPGGLSRSDVAVVGVALALCSYAGTACSAARAVSLDDILAMENVGAVEIDSTAKRIAFERIPAAAQRHNFGVDEPRLTGDVYIYVLGTGAAPRRLLADEQSEGSWIGGFSPNGSRLAVYWRERGAVRAGVYEFTTGSLVPFGFTPYFDFEQSGPVWLSEDELIYSSLSAGEQPARVAFREVAARRLARAWEQAWQGDLPTADVLTSSPTLDVPLRKGTLVRANAATGNAQTIALGLFVDLHLSPNGRYLVGLQRGGIRPPPRDSSARDLLGSYRFDAMLFDLKRHDGPRQVCSGCRIQVSSFQWSASGDRVAFFVDRTESGERRESWQVYYLQDARRVELPHRGLDLASQRQRGLQHRPEHAVPFGPGIAVAARAQERASAEPAFSDLPKRPSNAGRVDWYLVLPGGKSRNLTKQFRSVSQVLVATDEHALFVLADGDLWRIRERGQAVNLSASIPAQLTFSRRWDPEGGEVPDLFAKTVVLTSVNEVPTTLVAVDLARGAAISRARASAPHRLVAAARNGSAAVSRQDSSAGSTLVLDVAQGASESFWSFNTHLSGVQPADQLRLKYKLATGEEVEACALLPPEVSARKPSPVIVFVYPEPLTRCWSHYTQGFPDPYDPEILAAMGYAVLFPYAARELLRDTSRPYGDWAGIVLPALEAFVATGRADAERVGLFGWSGGGAAALATLTQTDRFRAAVVGNGAANFTSHYGTMGVVRRLWPNDLFSIGQSFYYESPSTFLWLGAAPWEAPERYVSASPLFHLEKIQTPIMLVHSDLDWNYPMEQFDEVFTGLFRLGKNAEYVRYWGEGHGLSSPANLRDLWARIAAWYGRYLGTESPGASPAPEGNQLAR